MNCGRQLHRENLLVLSHGMFLSIFRSELWSPISTGVSCYLYKNGHKLFMSTVHSKQLQDPKAAELHNPIHAYGLRGTGRKLSSLAEVEHLCPKAGIVGWPRASRQTLHQNTKHNLRLAYQFFFSVCQWREKEKDNAQGLSSAACVPC